MSVSWRSTSGHDRVLRPQSGLTHRSVASMKPRKCSRRVAIVSVPGRVRRMHVEDAGADLEMPIVEQLVELVDVALVLRAAELDGRHVDAGIGPERDDVAEVAVAHVRVHLDAGRLVEDVVEGGAHAAGVDRSAAPRRRRWAAAIARGPPARRPARSGRRPRRARAPRSAIGCATAQKSRSSGTPGGRKLQFTIVTGPVSMPFTGRPLAACATCHSRTVIGSCATAARPGSAAACSGCRS